jgi:hypothetical protein
MTAQVLEKAVIHKPGLTAVSVGVANFGKTSNPTGYFKMNHQEARLRLV